MSAADLSSPWPSAGVPPVRSSDIQGKGLSRKRLADALSTPAFLDRVGALQQEDTARPYCRQELRSLQACRGDRLNHVVRVAADLEQLSRQPETIDKSQRSSKGFPTPGGQAVCLTGSELRPL